MQGRAGPHRHQPPPGEGARVEGEGRGATRRRRLPRQRHRRRPPPPTRSCIGSPWNASRRQPPLDGPSSDEPPPRPPSPTRSCTSWHQSGRRGGGSSSSRSRGRGRGGPGRGGRRRGRVPPCRCPRQPRPSPAPRELACGEAEGSPWRSPSLRGTSGGCRARCLWRARVRSALLPMPCLRGMRAGTRRNRRHRIIPCPCCYVVGALPVRLMGCVGHRLLPRPLIGLVC